jgi:hypothetical protein
MEDAAAMSMIQMNVGSGIQGGQNEWLKNLFINFSARLLAFRPFYFIFY